MKFFKHFTDAHEGKSMMALMNKFGVAGYAYFFILAEICAAKLEKNAKRPLNEDDFKFTLNERLIRDKLRINSTKVELILSLCSTLNLLSFFKTEDEYIIHFPKLLESLDRDAKRARYERGASAAKARLDKDKDKDKEEDIDSGGGSLGEVGANETLDLGEIMKFWNSTVEGAKIKVLSEARKRKLRLRISEEIFYSNWKSIITAIAETPFLNGSKGKWRADFDWLIENDNNYVKVHEGKYSDTSEQKTYLDFVE